MVRSKKPAAEAAAKQSALAEVYQQYVRQMLAVANQVLHSGPEAEEAVRSALLAISRDLKDLPPEGTARRNYVLIAARNAALRLRKTKDVQSRVEEMTAPSYETGAESDPIFDRVAHSLDTERICALVMKLAPIYQDVLYLTYVERLEPHEIAELLQRKPNTVRQQLSRGRKMLMTLWEAEEAQK